MLYIYTKKNFVLIRVKVLKLIERSSTSMNSNDVYNPNQNTWSRSLTDCWYCCNEKKIFLLTYPIICNKILAYTRVYFIAKKAYTLYKKYKNIVWGTHFQGSMLRIYPQFGRLLLPTSFAASRHWSVFDNLKLAIWCIWSTELIVGIVGCPKNVAWYK